jgi:hypothetical protein
MSLSISMCCGAGVVVSEFVSACEECGRLIEDANLVHSEPLLSCHESCLSFNIVTEDDNGSCLLSSTCRKRKRSGKCTTIQSLEAQAACRAQALNLPVSVTKQISELLSSSFWVGTYVLSRAEPQTASAVLLYLGARLDNFPVTLRKLCAHFNIHFAPAVKLFSRIIGKMPGCFPPVPVRPSLLPSFAIDE